MANYAVRLFGGPDSADYSEKINMARMREERFAKAQASLRKNGIAACLLMRPENIRYVTSTRGADFINQLRYSVTFAEHDPILYEMPRALSSEFVPGLNRRISDWPYSGLMAPQGPKPPMKGLKNSLS